MLQLWALLDCVIACLIACLLASKLAGWLAADLIKLTVSGSNLSLCFFVFLKYGATVSRWQVVLASDIKSEGATVLSTVHCTVTIRDLPVRGRYRSVT